jgi:hypothetical protein
MAQDTSTPASVPDSEQARLARQAREAQALRENLRKRRLQAQSREADRRVPQDEA